MISTIQDLKIRTEPEAVPQAETEAPKSEVQKKKIDRHAEMKLRGLEKKRMLAALVPRPAKEENIQKAASEPNILKPLKMHAEAEPVSKKRKHVALFKDEKDSRELKTSLDPRKSMEAKTVYSDKKRKKMRERERAKREKLRARKEAKAEKTQKRIDNMPRFNETIERPSESIRELGSKLAQKLGKESQSFLSAYDKIKASRTLEN